MNTSPYAFISGASGGTFYFHDGMVLPLLFSTLPSFGGGAGPHDVKHYAKKKKPAFRRGKTSRDKLNPRRGRAKELRKLDDKYRRHIRGVGYESL